MTKKNAYKQSFKSHSKSLQANLGSKSYASLFVIIILFLSLLSSVTSASNSVRDNFCKQYDWAKVRQLVEPYLDEVSSTALVMQGLSSEYNTSVAASQAIHSQMPDEIYNTLNSIIQYNCP